MKLNGKIKCPNCKSTNVHPWMLKQANIWEDETNQIQIDAYKDKARISASCDNVIYQCQCDNCHINFYAMLTLDVSIKDIYTGDELYGIEALKVYEADKLKQEPVVPQRESVGRIMTFNNRENLIVRPEIPGEINKFFKGHDNILVKEYVLTDELELTKESLCGTGIMVTSIIDQLIEDGKSNYIGAVRITAGVHTLYTLLPTDMMTIQNNVLTLYRVEDGREFHTEFIIIVNDKVFE